MTSFCRWFEIPVHNLDRAATFYETVFGFSMKRGTSFGSGKVAIFPGEAGCLIQMEGVKPAKEGTCVYLAADDLEATLSRIEAAGGKIVFPITSVAPHGDVAVFEDSEGNYVALHRNP